MPALNITIGSSAEPDAAGVDSTGPWIDGALGALFAGVDSTGPWIDAALASAQAGVDSTGPWIEST
jgi:hypothetical protein